ncbi:TPA: hypothetical protein ACGSMQ_003070 [Escherichia coli]
MPDNVDFIQEQQAELLERQINAARVKHCGASALGCEECDAPIPAARVLFPHIHFSAPFMAAY